VLKHALFGNRAVRFRGIRLALVFAAAASGAMAQTTQAPDPREAKPERPTVATHAYAVAPGIVELEIGGQWQRQDPQSTLFTVPALFKIGLANRLQLDIFPGWVRTSLDGMAQSGMGDLLVGLKWQLAEDASLVGDFAVESTVKLATGSAARGTGTGTTDANVSLISSHSFGDLSLDVNAGYTRRSGDGTAAPKNATMWTVSAGHPVTGSLGWVAEVFGYPGTSGPAGSGLVVAFLTGPTLAVDRTFVLDAGAILNVSGFGNTAIYFGATWNIGRLWTPMPPAPGAAQTQARR
jgi:hypothetical protein